VSRPRISVVIPAHNAEPFLEATLRSALEQTLPPLEVIVVDDGSRDATASLAARFEPAVRVLQGGGRGVSAARNTGVAEARGDWIAFLDHDDLWLPDKLARQAFLVENDSAAVMAFTQASVLHGGQPSQGEIFPDIPDPDRLLAGAYEELVHWNFVPMSSVLARADVLRGLDGPFDPRWSLSEDWDLWLRVARRHPRGLRFVPAPLMRYRIVAGRATARMADLRLEDLAIFEEQIRAEPWLESRDPARCRAARHRMHREAGYWLMREGRRAEARSHLWAAWKLRPASLRPLGHLAATLIGAGGESRPPEAKAR
jgi:glycosyltransferase involved in cell wall biosynthesis